MIAGAFKKRIITLTTCSLNQWVLDFEGNTNRIIESIKQTRLLGGRFRTGAELELTGYGCKDHFLEPDTYYHSWESLLRIVDCPEAKDMLLDIGMPVQHRSVNYNCRVLAYNGKILLIRPKVYGCEEGNYVEYRYFRPWRRNQIIEQCRLPSIISERGPHYQRFAPIGNAILRTRDTEIGFEICQELWEGVTSGLYEALDGAEIICNGSGSHHQLRKLNRRIELMRSHTSKVGGVYIFANELGGDGGRLYFDGSSLIGANGNFYAITPQFSVNDVEVTAATIDLSETDGFRSHAFRLAPGLQQKEIKRFKRVDLDVNLCDNGKSEAEKLLELTPPISINYFKPEEEIALGPACWLWDYLRRSGARGFFLPLSGGADSSAVATIVSSMAHLLFDVINAFKRGNMSSLESYNSKIVLADLCRVLHISNEADLFKKIEKPQDITRRLFVTCYMGTQNSSQETRNRAKNLAGEIGSIHLDTSVDTMVRGMEGTFKEIMGRGPKFEVHGGTKAEDLALQNIQARLRMVLSYMLAQLLPETNNALKNEETGKGGGFLLVLGSANIDEGLRGYMTKYDCSSADINPIGGINKIDLRAFLHWAAKKFGHSTLLEVAGATATAELRPLKDGKLEQNDEHEMGMTYEELREFGTLRKIEYCGPVSMFEKLLLKWKGKHSPEVIAEKVKRFFKYYAINRHKSTVLTPSYHAENYGAQNDIFDMRPFLYDVSWKYQFALIDQKVKAIQRQPEPKL